MVLLRQQIGDVLRDFRMRRGDTLRKVAGSASVAPGYLSELERGQKEASSEVLASIADALEVNLSEVINEAGQRLALSEALTVSFDESVMSVTDFKEFSGRFVERELV
ncbi:helix-turn-helix domain-containing protein [Canibacter sp. lx-72]|uniref:helix-turn-helix domain-containing protein n=1 Tax=Canibacter zhuwentaonis TaxID=2837491 RepID=UPI001BDCD139|nr:helix-turn-helix transcriptional regulator [Canibacter zhuwentaonis]MBT1017935.1 helix-turn-helix domain-containing protein [Canibacter zhuwentaonis]MBT1035098.1 helix-turn-helix domain-containing protein [Canibacter zhuwentaonis]